MFAPRLPAAEDPGGRGLHRPNRRLVYALLGIVAVIVVIRLVAPPHHGPAAAATGLPTSCSRASFRVDGTSFPAGNPIAVDITGPANAAYAVEIDVAGGAPVRLVEADGLPRCSVERQVTLPAAVRAGRHTLTLLRIADGDAATTLQTLPLTIT